MPNKTFSVRHGIDVANTIIVDASRNLSNIATANITTVNATNFVTVAGLNLPDHTNNAYFAANSAANTVRISQNGAGTLHSKSLNFVNSANVTIVVTDSGNGNANITFDVLSGGGASQVFSDVFTANGVQFVFGLSRVPAPNSVFVFIDGVTQAPVTDYTVSGNSVIFVSAPEANSNIEIRSFATVTVLSPANNISNDSTNLQISNSYYSFTTGGFNTSVDSISKTYLMRGTTNNNTETELFLLGNSRISVSINTTVFYTADIVARRTDAINESAGFYIKGVVDNFSGSVTDVGDLYEIVVAEDDASLLVDARADDTNNTINIYVTGASGKTIRWTALVRTVEVAQ